MGAQPQNTHKKVQPGGPTTTMILLRRHEEEEGAAAAEQVGVEVLNKLGSGGFGAVYRAKVIAPPVLHHHDTSLKQSAAAKYDQEEVALKVLAAFTKDEKDAADHEVRVMRTLTSTTDPDCRPDSDAADYIVGLRHHLTNYGSDKRYLAMELCKGGSLRQVMDRRGFCEREAATVFVRLVRALMLCHGKGVVHRDVKPENMLLLRPWDLSSVKLADFGLATMFDQRQLAYNPRHCCVWDAAGTPGYMAPELQDGSPCSPWETDVWSAGVVLFEMLTGDLPPPPPPGCPEALLDLESQHLWPAHRCVSFPARHLVRHMLSINPKKRPTLASILKHPWVARFCAASLAPHDQPGPVASTTSCAPSMEKATGQALALPPRPLVDAVEATPYSPGRLLQLPALLQLQNGTNPRHGRHDQLHCRINPPTQRPPQLCEEIHVAVRALAIRT